jgi:AcrR family transcriptional regulator
MAGGRDVADEGAVAASQRRRVPQRKETRAPLTRDRVLAAAVELADESGIHALSMRRLGQRLGVEAMSLYNHVSSKEDLLDGMAERVVSEYHVPVTGGDWRDELGRSALAARDALVRHPWAGAVLESRTTSGPVRLRYLEATLAALRGAGFSVRSSHRVVMTLDSYVYGFTLQETSWPIPAEQAQGAAADFAATLPAEQYPRIAELVGAFVARGHDPSAEFALGLEMLLDALAGLRSEPG